MKTSNPTQHLKYLYNEKKGKEDITISIHMRAKRNKTLQNLTHTHKTIVAMSEVQKRKINSISQTKSDLYRIDQIKTTHQREEILKAYLNSDT
jgi:hypothetical protein